MNLSVVQTAPRHRVCSPETPVWVDGVRGGREGSEGGGVEPLSLSDGPSPLAQSLSLFPHFHSLRTGGVCVSGVEKATLHVAREGEIEGSFVRYEGAWEPLRRLGMPLLTEGSVFYISFWIF